MRILVKKGFRKKGNKKKIVFTNYVEYVTSSILSAVYWPTESITTIITAVLQPVQFTYESLHAVGFSQKFCFTHRIMLIIQLTFLFINTLSALIYPAIRQGILLCRLSVALTTTAPTY